MPRVPQQNRRTPPSRIHTTPASRPPRIEVVRRGTMSSPNDRDAIKITAEVLAGVVIPEPVGSVPSALSTGARVYGTINETAEQFVSVPTERASVFLQGWFYLGLAGLLAALARGAVAVPGFADGTSGRFHSHRLCSSRWCSWCCRSRRAALVGHERA